MRLFFVFFFLSGFCSVLYELVWLRLAMAHFGVTSGVTSVIISSFMAGLGLGSLFTGRMLKRHTFNVWPIKNIYGLTELIIGCSALLVPLLFNLGSHIIEPISQTSSWTWIILTSIWIAITLIPWCFCMGATFPIGMQVVKNHFHQHQHTSFSYLYVANVLGAFAGALIPLLIIENIGFHLTLVFGASLNALIALMVFTIKIPAATKNATSSADSSTTSMILSSQQKNILVLLFFTGFTSMGLEVIWIRLYTPFLGTVVYAFALILSVYLICTFIGSKIYRYLKDSARTPSFAVWLILWLSMFLPLTISSPDIHIPTNINLSGILKLLIGIGPFSTLLGFITPYLIDTYSRGEPEKAGSAYAYNIAGCIVGPLIAGFAFLPMLSEPISIFLFSLPWLIVCIFSPSSKNFTLHPAMKVMVISIVGIVMFFFVNAKQPYGYLHPQRILRDHTATVIAGGRGLDKRLHINGGEGMTTLTPITKFMAHLPLASLSYKPKNAAVICFGMGTTFRSLLSWDIESTGVELIPSVPKLFEFYHSDANKILASPLAHIQIDDGRRYLSHTNKMFDVITIDPPPPIEATASSLLYSIELYSIIKKHLRAGGIMQQWLPNSDEQTQAAITRAIAESFNYVRAFKSVAGWGIHFLASDQPLPHLDATTLANKLSAKAKRDLTEWGPEDSAEKQFSALLKNEISPEILMAKYPHIPPIRDDLPINEYYLLRRLTISKYQANEV